jgi:hypothetical protein
MDIKELDALLASAKRPETVVPLCLRGDLQGEWEELETRLATLQTGGHGKLAGSADNRELAQRILNLQTEMSESTVYVKLQALHRREWRELVAAHPARKDSDADKILGINQDTFFDSLVASCIVEPELTEEQTSALLDALTSSQFDKLTDAAWGLNRRDVSVPFSSAASQLSQTGGETSKPQSGSESATGGSAAGSRKRSRSTSTPKMAG